MFLLLLPLVLEFLTKLEGHVSYSQISKYTCFKYHVFLVVNVFFGNILIGSVFEQMKHYIAAPTTYDFTGISLSLSLSVLSR